MTMTTPRSPAASERSRYEDLVHTNSTWLYRYAYWLCGEKNIAEDLVQETLLRAWRFLDSLKDERAAKPWLTTILRRENARRFERRRLEYVDTEIGEIPMERQEAETRPEIIALRNAIRELPIKYREPLLLQVIQGHTLDDIARMLQVPRSTVATRLFRARERLHNKLQVDDDSRRASGPSGLQTTGAGRSRRNIQ